MRRVLHIITSLENGGAQSFLLRLILSDKMNAHFILCFRSEERTFKGFAKHAKFVKCINVLNIVGIYNYIKNVAPDVMQTWLYHSDLIGGLYGFFMRIPTCWNIRNSNLFKSGDVSITAAFAIFGSIILSKLSKKLVIVANSKSGINFHVNIGYAQDKFRLIENGVEIRSRKSLYFNNLDEKIINFVVLGRYSPSKGYEYLIEELATIKNKNFLVKCYGKNVNDQNINLKKLVEKYEIGNKIKLCGEYLHIEEAFNGVHFLVLASISEGFPNVLIEAMSFGVPCVVSNVGDSKVIVGDSGLTYDLQEGALSSSISDAISIYVDDREKYKVMSSRARQIIIDNYSIEKIVKKYQNLWEEVCG